MAEKHSNVRLFIVYTAIIVAITSTTYMLYQPYLQSISIPVVYFGVIYAAMNGGFALGGKIAHRIEEILKEIDIARSKADKWLKKFITQKLVKRIKQRNKMPYYIANYKSPEYRNKKRLFALNIFYKTGFLNHLSSLKAKIVVIFGSFSRSDWYKESDIDLFIYGDDDKLEIGKYQLILNREVQLFTAKNKKDLKRMGSGLIQNILDGYFVKGYFDQLGVKLNA